MEVVLTDDNLLFAVFDALDLGTPAAGGLKSRLDGLRAGIHGEDHLFARQFAEFLIEVAENGVVEGAGGERHLVELVFRGGHDLGVTVSEVKGRIGREHVKILASLGVAYDYALSLNDDDIFGVIVVCAEFVCLVDNLLCAEHFFSSS